MGFFRKRISIQEAHKIFIPILFSRFDIEIQKFDKNIREIVGEYIDAIITDDVRVTSARDLWIVCAAHLSGLRQRGESAQLMSSILDLYRASTENENRKTYLIGEVIAITASRSSSAFNTANLHVFKHKFPEIERYICKSGDDSEGKYALDGMEMASCLRAADFFTGEFKVIF